MQIINVFSIFDASELTLPNVSVHPEHNLDTFYERNELVFVDGAERTIAYSQQDIGEEEDEYLLINDETIEKAYLFEATAYRGTGCYCGFVKVDGKWWECDFVSEGQATQVDISDEDMAVLVAENKQYTQGDE